jgi:hypothetical protein
MCRAGVEAAKMGSTAAQFFAATIQLQAAKIA